jgi:hypothetical protein
MEAVEQCVMLVYLLHEYPTGRIRRTSPAGALRCRAAPGPLPNAHHHHAWGGWLIACLRDTQTLSRAPAAGKHNNQYSFPGVPPTELHPHVLHELYVVVTAARVGGRAVVDFRRCF